MTTHNEMPKCYYCAEEDNVKAMQSAGNKVCENCKREMPKTQPELQVKRMEQKRSKNLMPKDIVEEEKTLFDAWYKDQKEMNPYIIRDYFLHRITTVYNKGFEVGRGEVVTFAQTLLTLIERGNVETVMNIIKEKSTPPPDDQL